MNKKQIDKLIKERSKILKKDYDSPKVDKIRDTIIKEFCNNFDKYEVDFIIESFTHFGYCPNLIYDDNGRFAVSSVGFQPVAIKKIEGEFTVFVKKKQWKKTIRKALKIYVDKCAKHCK